MEAHVLLCQRYSLCTHICVKTENEQIEMFDMFDKLLVLMCNRIETAILNERVSILFYFIVLKSAKASVLQTRAFDRKL